MPASPHFPMLHPDKPVAGGPIAEKPPRAGDHQPENCQTPCYRSPLCGFEYAPSHGLWLCFLSGSLSLSPGPTLRTPHHPLCLRHSPQIVPALPTMPLRHRQNAPPPRQNKQGSNYHREWPQRNHSRHRQVQHTAIPKRDRQQIPRRVNSTQKATPRLDSPSAVDPHSTFTQANHPAHR